MKYQTKLTIDGALVDGDRPLEVIDPATGKVFVTVGSASPQQAEKAVQAAKRAQPNWEALGRTARASMLKEIADRIEARADDFTDVMVAEQGKPRREAAEETAYSVAFIRYFASLDLPNRLLSVPTSGRVELRHRPLGVVVGISPWNFPLLIPAAKIAPALLTGNTMVVKPAPTTPILALMLGEIAAAILPPGVLNVITDKNDLGDLLTSHPEVAKVTFTGSTATGRKIMANAAPTLKRLTLELGGNDAAIVLDDVDVEKTAERIFAAAFFNTGQACLAIKRVYVPDAIYDEFSEAVARHAREAIVGPGSSPGTRIGPLQNRQQFEKAQYYLDVARRDGRIIPGGEVRHGDGYFIAPTVVRDIDDTSQLVSQEQFSPILPIVRVADGEDALRRANASDFGLGGSVWSGDATRARALAGRMQSGTVWVNQHLNFGPEIPLAGAKQSGIGVEWAELGLAEFCQINVINQVA
ncbi:aldehyde dehydrogenase family protein [Belnapia sp. T18]|uniref:Aldehyde dehydrogenase family protein n=1 Tax=Belnapia arida TaxID=2804533 RepID=A0ABS1U952_9PROT|nr:aldehyde dehydrogenase family protein [Belnapia arida]MBL6081218.1 aldehyde dehydrogenase family protein [Belnapia arida]